MVTLNRNEPKILWKKINDLVREKKSSNSNVHGISASEFNKYFSTIGNKVSSGLPKHGVPKWKNPPPIYSFIFKEIDVASVPGDLHSLDGDSSNDVLQLDAKLLRMSADVICRTSPIYIIYHWVPRLSQVNGNWLELLPSIRDRGMCIGKLITVQYQYCHTSQRYLKGMSTSKMLIILSIIVS